MGFYIHCRRLLPADVNAISSHSKGCYPTEAFALYLRKLYPLVGDILTVSAAGKCIYNSNQTHLVEKPANT